MTRFHAALASFLLTVSAGALFATAWATKQEVYAVAGGVALTVSMGLDLIFLRPKKA
ncbi:hypothetical protein HOU00_gp048 [Caulobacter phage CcrPW]|uniref:Uncharacterized protein n=1 Tax=Caulobacter phage CcrPW TaxID=2283271 RepID=A0A385ECP5_9CAUD|nr:hypothetical protein HOU00_gp048 [Caulobacter phage CcrPW]AXQ68587.1 hypothetical protein CcrPW_gp048 [Caulobacter phage CcrPW]